MQNAWRVIDCTNLQGELRYIRGRILVCDHALEQKVEIPLAETAILLCFFNHKMSYKGWNSTILDDIPIISRMVEANFQRVRRLGFPIRNYIKNGRS